jgi:hypothetical protein
MDPADDLADPFGNLRVEHAATWSDRDITA